MGSRTATPPNEPSSPNDGGIRKRVCKACDRCRLKKSKCDGSTPCSRCKADNAICVFGERKKSQDKVYPKGYVEMLESQQSQLVSGLQELYRRLQNGEGWTGPPLKESTRGSPLTHDILEHLGALKTDSKTGLDHFEENYDALQSILFANGATSMRHDGSFDTNSDVGQSPTFEAPTHPTMLPYPTSFSAVQFPPTPPVGSPHPFYTKTSSPLKAEMAISTTSGTPQYTQWPVEPLDYTHMEYDMTYEEPLDDPQMRPMVFNQSMFTASDNVAINPCLTMKQWPSQDDPSHRYFNNTFT